MTATAMLLPQVVKVGLRTYGGKAANIEATSARQVILATVMKGLLQYTKECKTVPSLINSPFLSKEMGIETNIDDKASTVFSGGLGSGVDVGVVFTVVVMWLVVATMSLLVTTEVSDVALRIDGTLLVISPLVVTSPQTLRLLISGLPVIWCVLVVN